jgi:hypothetical protein
VIDVETSGLDMRSITIPACDDHAGVIKCTLIVPWFCIYCGQRRGEPYVKKIWDSTQSMNVTAWDNPCGHNETYSAIRGWLDFKAEVGEMPAQGK